MSFVTTVRCPDSSEMCTLPQNGSADVESSDDWLCAYGNKGLMDAALNYPTVLALIADLLSPSNLL